MTHNRNQGERHAPPAKSDGAPRLTHPPGAGGSATQWGFGGATAGSRVFGRNTHKVAPGTREAGRSATNSPIAPRAPRTLPQVWNTCRISRTELKKNDQTQLTSEDETPRRMRRLARPNPRYADFVINEQKFGLLFRMPGGNSRP